MSDPTETWARRLASIAEPVLQGTPLTSPSTPAAIREFITSFADELGHRRAVDPYVLSTMLNTPAGPPPDSAAAPDVKAWASVASGRAVEGVDLSGSGPLAYPHAADGIEIATEIELSVLHALWRSAIVTGSGIALARAHSAAAWAIAHLQPDNATGHPWAAGLFIARWVEAGDIAARMYADTLIHNSIVAAGRPDRFSAVLLLDAAGLLRMGRQAG